MQAVSSVRSSILLVAIFCWAVAITAGHASAAVTFHTVALTGQHAPGTPEGTLFSEVGGLTEPPAINNLGEVVFRASLDNEDGGGDVQFGNQMGIWSDVGGTLHLEFREGDPAPGAPEGVSFEGFSLPRLNDAGNMAFTGNLWRHELGSYTAEEAGIGIWLQSAADFHLSVRDGDPAPGPPAGATFGAFSNLVMNDADQMAFIGGMQPGSGDVTDQNRGGIWSGTDGSFALVARQGTHAPGTVADANFYQFFPIAIGGGGQVAFRAYLQQGAGGVTYDNREGIWSDAGGSLDLVARQGSQAPGTPAGANFGGFISYSLGGVDIPALNATGQIAFYADLVPGSGGVTEDNDSGIWSDRDGALDVLVRAGDSAPDTAAASFADFTPPAMNDAGQVAFAGSLSAGTGDAAAANDSGIWSEGGGTLQLVAREGEHAPGTPAGAEFAQFYAPTGCPVPLLNNAGQVAFRAGLEVGAGGVTDGNNSGIWAEDADDVLRLVLREGDLLDVDDGPGVDLRTVWRFSLLGNTGYDDGPAVASGFNDRGQLALYVDFLGGSSGIFVASLSVVPEPAAAALAALGLVGLFVARRRR